MGRNDLPGNSERGRPNARFCCLPVDSGRAWRNGIVPGLFILGERGDLLGRALRAGEKWGKTDSRLHRPPISAAASPFHNVSYFIPRRTRLLLADRERALVTRLPG